VIFREQSKLLWSSFWRALAWSFHPKMLLLGLVPFALSAVIASIAMFLLWEPGVAAVQRLLSEQLVFSSVFGMVEKMGWLQSRALLAPYLLVAVVLPVLVVLVLLCVLFFAVPSVTHFVAAKRYPGLVAKGRLPFLQIFLHGLLYAVIALALMLASSPLWFVPFVYFVLPALIWGWLAFSVLSFAALAEHASLSELRLIKRNRRAHLLLIGVITGLIGAIPTTVLIFAGPAFPLMSLAALWLYAAGFLFAALWTASYALGALQEHREEQLALAALG
jgi:hypothetical protein